MTQTPETAPVSTPRSAAILQLVRGLFHLASVVIVSLWGFVSWPLPFPGVFTGLGFLVVSALVWALFLSPKPVLRTDRFGQALIELMLLAAAVAALLDFGVFWAWAAVFGVAGAVIGYVVSARAR